MEHPFIHPVVVRELANGLQGSPDALQRYQDERLRRLVRHAAQRVPFYRSLYQKAGVDAQAFRGLADLEKLPVVTRQQLQDTPAEHLVAEGIDPATLVTRKTSGSSGAPLAIRRSRLEEFFLQAVRLRARACLGLRPWHKTARVSLTAKRPALGVPQFTSEMRRNFPFPFIKLNAFEDPAVLARALAEYQPAVLSGSPGYLERVCVQGDPQFLARVRPQFIGCGGETLRPSVRGCIESTFNAPVFDFYGSHEFNLVAWQREHRGHFEVASLTTIGEVLRPASMDGPPERVAAGESGEFVGTALWSFSAPFIRYRLGDEVTLREPHPVFGTCLSLSRVQGRVTERFVTRDGTSIHAYQAVLPLLAAAPWLRSYQLEQVDAGSLLIRVTSSATVSDTQQQQAAAQINAAFGGGIQACLQLVDELTPSANGKTPLFIRHVQLPGAGR